METQLEKPLKEGAWAAILGVHVLNRLAVHKQMTIDSGFADKTGTCPCGCLTPIRFGDNSMGHEAVWHGSVGIILGPVAVVSLCGEKSSDDTEETSSAAEMNRTLIEDSRDEIIAETIVFSFTQQTGLVPTICVTKDSFKILMYDVDTDLLYESAEMPLFSITLDGTEFNLTTVVALWFVINYSHFCTGVKSSHEEFGYNANFKRLVDKKYSIYKKDIKLGGCKQHVKNPEGQYKGPENSGKFPSL